MTSNPTSTITIYKNGSLVEQGWSSYKGKPTRGGSGGGPKKPCKGLSDQSRRSAQRFISKLDSRKVAEAGTFWVTLTFPSSLQDAPKERRSKWLDSLREKLVYRYPGCGVVWRMGLFSKRGLWFPHFHLLVIGISEEEKGEFRRFVRTAWYKSCGRLSEDHKRLGTHTIRVRSASSFDRIKRYMFKREHDRTGNYLRPEKETGRCTGRWNESYLASFITPVRAKTEEVEGDGELDRVGTRIRRILAKKSKRGLSGTFYNSSTFAPYEDVRKLLSFYGVADFIETPRDYSRLSGSRQLSSTYLQTSTLQSAINLDKQIPSGLDIAHVFPYLTPDDLYLGGPKPKLKRGDSLRGIASMKAAKAIEDPPLTT